ncbi:DUF4328 domain-containing protein [Streptomyces sp. AV19]|uniref:DUF4328 domain-containing protein n=1 Tax=Streptomyces sp. AV19 TaxID=2793068 RepID=UPI0018FF0CBF|nr:DUF4328 domain-containing protein [Streptomyces sp. AV19]MBH1935910.1 DUF4328 domain-containing protein [Streptomyces sp. AV19]MDG4534307.1 DUF4328 domain-containing protein [Streptomyces sp. AV19]
MPPTGVDLRRGVRLSLNALLTLSLLALLLLAAARFQQRGALAELAEGAADRADAADAFHASMVLVAGVPVLGTLVLWAVWFRRVRLNAETLAPGSHRFGSGWAAGAWFTPVVNLWFPKQIANDIYRASAPAGPQGPPKGLLNSWWVCGLVAGAVNAAATTAYALAEARVRRSFRLGVDGSWEEDVRRLRMLAGVSAFGYLLCAVVGVLALLVIRQLTRMQEERALVAVEYEPAAAHPDDPYGALPSVPPGPYGPPYGNPYGNPYGDAYGGGPAGY